MQGTGSTLFVVPGVLVLMTNGSPILFWIAIISIVLATVFLLYAVVKRRKEARESREPTVVDHRVT